jgi:hypothetical protein
MVFSEEDKHLIKGLRQSKSYSSRKFIREFPEKKWSRRGLDCLIKKIDETGSIKRKPGSGRPRSQRTAANVELVEELVLSQDDRPQTHLSQRQISRSTGINRCAIQRIIDKDLHLKCLRKKHAQELTASNRNARYVRCKQLLRRYPAHLVPFVWFTDEKVFTVAHPINPQNDRVYVNKIVKKKDVAPARLLRTRSTFSKSVMVSVGISMLGCTSLHFVEPGIKVNGAYYRDVLLRQNLLPDIKRVSGDLFIFQQDGAPAHRAKETVQLLQDETPDFIPPTLWPPNSPDLNPVDYKVWSALQQKVYNHNIPDVNCLRRYITEEWGKMDQRMFDAAIKQWRNRLHACVNARGGHFEYKL